MAEVVDYDVISEEEVIQVRTRFEIYGGASTEYDGHNSIELRVLEMASCSNSKK